MRYSRAHESTERLIPDYAIRTMSRVELDRAVDLAAVEGWNPGPHHAVAFPTRAIPGGDRARAVAWAAVEGGTPGQHDAIAFHACDPRGFVVGLLDGEPI